MTTRITLLFIAILPLFGSSCSNKAEPLVAASVPKIQITSDAFVNGQPIPPKYTGQGDDISPPFQWTDVPPQTKSLALICEDPDAPSGTFTHWVMYNMPSSEVVLSENIAKTATLDDGRKQGQNSFGNIGYNGPMPPPGNPHRYFFRLYALDTTLTLAAGASKEDVVNAMNGHILAEGELMGTYQRQ